MSKTTTACVVGSDLGTSGCKSIILDAHGQIIGWALDSYPTLRKKPGWAEQHPEDWFDAFCSTVKKAIADAAVKTTDIKAVCIVGITHNAVLLGEDDEVIRPSIIYTDTRSSDQSATLLDRWENTVFQRTCNQVGPLWTWPQLLWIRENEPQNWEKIQKILFPKDYVRHRITPHFTSDTIDPVGTLLYDPKTNTWIDEFLADLGLSENVFPQPKPSLEIIGDISEQAAHETGLSKGTPVIVGTTDTAAEVFGVGAIRLGQAFIKLATVGRIAAVSQKPLLDPAILNYPHVVNGLWYPGTATKFGASAFKWARQAFWVDENMSMDYEHMDQVAATVPPGSGGMIFHPYLDGEFAPYWDSCLKGSFLGVSLQQRRAHFTRSVMEGVGYAIRDALESVMAMGLQVDEIRLIGGGAASDLWAQIITDVLNRQVIVPEGTDAAYGAAVLAGIAMGLFDAEPEFIDQLIRIRARFHPDPDTVQMYEELFGIYREATHAMRETAYHLHQFQTTHNAPLENDDQD